VAIIDQKLDIGHPEYNDSIVDYVEYDEEVEKDGIGIHGPAVASLLVGKDCGVAPGAKLVYKAVPCGRNFLPYAKSLKNIIEDNKNVPQNEKVRVVSCSIGYMLDKPEPRLDEWVDTLGKAKEAGIFVIDTEGDQIGIPFGCGGSPGNKDDFESYLPWLEKEAKNKMKKEKRNNNSV